MNGNKTIWLMRHGSLPEEFDGQLIGSRDVPLSEQGRDEAIAAAQLIARLGDFEHVWCSPQLRARQTAELALSMAQLANMELLPELCEMCFGELEGLTGDEVAASHPDAYAAWSGDNLDFTFPGGESLRDLAERVAALKARVLAVRGDVLMVSHGGPLLELLCALLGLPRSRRMSFKLDRGALCRIDISPDGVGVLGVLNVKPEASLGAKPDSVRKPCQSR